MLSMCKSDQEDYIFNGEEEKRRNIPATLFSSSLPPSKLQEMESQTSLFGLKELQSHSNRSSGTLTRASLGSMVQKGKFSAGIASFVSVLKRVDLPTFGNPT